MTTVAPVTHEVPEQPVRLEAVADALGPRTARSTRRRTPARAVAALVTADALAAGLVSLLPLAAAPIQAPTLALVLVWVTALITIGAYSSLEEPLWPSQARRAIVAGFAVAALLPLWMPEGHVAWHAVVTAGLLVGTALLARQVRCLVVRLTRGSTAPLRVVVAGHRREVDRIMTELTASRTPRYEVVAVCGAGNGSPAALEEVRDTALRTHADVVLVAPCGHVGPADLRRLGWQLEGSRTQLLLGTSVLDVSPARARLSYVGSLAVVGVRHRTTDPGRLLVKGVGDRILALLGLLALAPLLLAVALAVRLDSPGSPLFRQTRMGRNGSTFTMYKFRTMRRDADAQKAELAALAGDSILFKVRDDPRTTRVGRYLRRYSIDELPQLLNVVRGDMALVGPRPPLPQEVAKYHSDVRRRLVVKPGMTGLWQISGRSDLSWDESVRLDLRYVDNWSLGLDLGILARTLGAVVRHRGAY